jgi:prevent-host-death family protein
MCYNVRQMGNPAVGVRELRQNLSVYLRRVQAGEALEVTDRGRPVAMLVPLTKPSTAVERLVASGRASPSEGDLIELGPPSGRVSKRLSRALASEREERLES